MKNKINIFLRVKNKINDVLGKGPDRYLNDVSGIIHVGANTGQERDLYRKNNLKVLWVEPIPKVFEKLKENIKNYKNQKAVKALVTDVNNKEYNFNIANNEGASSSILNLNKHKEIWPEVFYEKTLVLISTTLETLIKENNINLKKYQALVIDTQGSELLVLKGCKSSLDYFEYISIEVADFQSYENCCTLEEINYFMRENGFTQLVRRKFAEKRNLGSYYDIVYKRN